MDQSRPPTGVSLNADGNINANRSTFVGGDHVTHKNTRVRLGLGGLAAVVVLAAGGFATYQVVVSSSDVTAESGTSGARRTVEALLAAEVDGDAAEWCRLASSSSGAQCTGYLTSVFAAPNSLRDKARDATVNGVTGTAQSASAQISMRGNALGDVPMEWTGERWQLSRTFYLLALNNGGLGASGDAALRGCGILFGQPTECR